MLSRLALFMLVFVLVAAAPAAGQWTDNGSTLSTNDNLGIGVSSSQYPIHMRAPSPYLRIEGSSYNQYIKAGLRLSVKSSVNAYFEVSASRSYDDRSDFVLTQVRNGAYNHFLRFNGRTGDITLDPRATRDDAFGSVSVAGGRFGIGVTNPSHTLQVESGNKTIGGWGGNLSNAWIRMDGTYIDPNEYYASEDFHIGTLNEKPIYLGTNGTTRLAINPSGRVGIGTSNTPEQLTVNGGVLAEEVTVKLAANWPDYVFADGYDLPELSEVRAFIDVNGHLEGMPAASQVERDGVRLGQTQAALLEKIEELTLYAIDQDEQIRDQQSTVDAHAETIRELQNQLAQQQAALQAIQEQLRRLRTE